MTREKSTSREAFWRDLLERHAASGLSIRQFCAEVGVSQPSFYSWRRRLEKSGRRTAGDRQAAVADKDDAFIPLTLLDAPGTLDVLHPQGYRVRITGSVNADNLKQVLDVLDERGNR